MRNCFRNAWESWRRLFRRFDPATGGRKRNLLRAIISPSRCKLAELQLCPEKWENLVLRYQRKLRKQLDDELKLSGLEALVPEELERHLLLNSSRLDTYEKARAEIVTYTEAKTCLRLKDADHGHSRHDHRHDDPMDTSSFQKGGKHGKAKGSQKGGGKAPVNGGCFLCGGAHFQRDCPKAGGKKGDGKHGKNA